MKDKITNIGNTRHTDGARNKALEKAKGGKRYVAAPMPENYTSMGHEARAKYYKEHKGKYVSAAVDKKTGKYKNTY